MKRAQDLRQTPFAEERRALLEAACWQTCLPDAPIRLSPQLLAFDDWDSARPPQSTSARDRSNAEGLMLKRAGTAPTLPGRKKGDWWKWKLDPLTIDAVMIYAQSGSRPPGEPLYRFHLCGAGTAIRSGALHQGLFGPHRRGISQASPHWVKQATRWNASARCGRVTPDPRLRDRLRGHRRLPVPPQVGCLPCAFPA